MDLKNPFDSYLANDLCLHIWQLLVRAADAEECFFGVESGLIASEECQMKWVPCC